MSTPAPQPAAAPPAPTGRQPTPAPAAPELLELVEPGTSCLLDGTCD